MPELVADCPRCDVKKMTFKLESALFVGQSMNWQRHWEAFCICGHCKRSTVFQLDQNAPSDQQVFGKNPLDTIQGVVNSLVDVRGYVSLTDIAAASPPEFLPENVLDAFNEGAKCMAVKCYNAAGTMFRLCVDFASQDKLPDANENGLNTTIRRSLGHRLKWLFDNNLLPEALRDLSTCIKEDGNDGAHQGTLTEADAYDLLDFTEALLTRLYTEPERLRIAGERRSARRK